MARKIANWRQLSPNSTGCARAFAKKIRSFVEQGHGDDAYRDSPKASREIEELITDQIAVGYQDL